MTDMADSIQNAGITAKERLERIENTLGRIEEKLDNKADKAEVVALELRVRHMEQHGLGQVDEVITKVADIRTEANHQLDQMKKTIDNLTKNQGKLSTKLAYATGTIATLMILLEILSRVWLK